MLQSYAADVTETESYQKQSGDGDSRIKVPPIHTADQWRFTLFLEPQNNWTKGYLAFAE